MKSFFKNVFLTAMLLAWLCLLPPARAATQLFTNVYTFSMLSTPYTGTNVEGAEPMAALILSSNTLYGTTYEGGNSAKGSVFRVNINGGSFTNLHNFSAGNTNGLGIFTNGDGATLVSGLILVGNTLYGTAQYGGTNGRGTVFRVNTDGTAFTNLHNFTALMPPYYTNSDGGNPQAALILSGNILYGTAEYGGTNNCGTIFSINTDGTGFTNVCSFNGFNGGQYPVGGLLLANGTLYGTTSIGTSNDSGAVFAVSTNGQGLTNVYAFSATTDYINSDGASPYGNLVLSGSTLYGSTVGAGALQHGTLFSVNTNGTGFLTMHTFNGTDGGGPYAGMLLFGSTLFGTTYMGGTSGQGAIFSIGTNGGSFTTLHSLNAYDGVYPSGGLVASSNTLYGAASEGGSSNQVILGSGSIFSLLILPQLNIASVGTNAVLSWSTNYPGFTLQSATNPASAVWSAVSPAPVVANGQETVTNGVTRTNRYYRLIL